MPDLIRHPPSCWLVEAGGPRIRSGVTIEWKDSTGPDMDWFQLKQSISIFTGLHMDALHVHVGVIAQLLTAAAMRRSVASPWPWLLLLLAVLANEGFDLAYEVWPNRDGQIAESVRDSWNTMLLPTLLLLASRLAPRLLVRPPAEGSEPDSAAQE